MNKIFFAAAVLMLSLSQSFYASAQTMAVASVAATIVIPTTVSKESDLQFDNVSVAGTTNTDRNMASAQHVVRASIKISGYPQYAFSVTIPSQVTAGAREHAFAIGTKQCSENNSGLLSKNGTADITIEGAITYSGKTRVAPYVIAMNDDDEQFEVPNGLPVIINNN
jgi:hypothetical protein